MSHFLLKLNLLAWIFFQMELNFNLKIKWKLKQFLKFFFIILSYFCLFVCAESNFIGSLIVAVPQPKLNLLHSLCWNCRVPPRLVALFSNDKILTNALALHIWCLATPPPRIIIPVLFAATAMLLILVISEIQVHPKKEQVNEQWAHWKRRGRGGLVCKPQ